MNGAIALESIRKDKNNDSKCKYQGVWMARS